jgi:hypothetical protein
MADLLGLMGAIRTAAAEFDSLLVAGPVQREKPVRLSRAGSAGNRPVTQLTVLNGSVD